MDYSNLTLCYGLDLYGTSPRQITLQNWLRLCAGLDPFQEKRSRPVLMPHGWFSSRRADSCITHSGCVQIDIDAKHQSKPIQWDDLAQVMAEEPGAVLAQRSASGDGLWLLVAVKGISKADHRERADRVVAHFEDRFGVVVDHPVSRNLASVRFASSHLAHVNFGAEPWPY
jgi:hypothetical protein